MEQIVQQEALAEIQEQGSLKGVEYSGVDDAALPSVLKRVRAGMSSDVHRERLEKYVAAHNERWAVVATCETCNEPLIAEEVVQHSINHLTSGARALAGGYVRATPEVRAAFRAWLEAFEKGA